MRRIFLLVILLTSSLFAAAAPPTAKSITALRALLPGAYPAVQLLGYTSPGDGGGGIVNWVSGSTKAAAACSVYVPDVIPATGRWERPASPFRLARQCGVMTMDDTISGIVTYKDLVGSGTRMVVVSATGTTSTQSIPAGASLANPTGTIGLTAVNGVLTTPPRSDGAPALSQAIVPTWTGIHTFTPAPVFSSVTASQILSVNGSKALTSVGTTGTGSVVLAASPTLTGTLAAANGTFSGTLGLTGVGTFTAAPVFSSVTASQILSVDGSKSLVSVGTTGTGSVVLAASPTLTGTLAAANGTFSGTLGITGNITGTTLVGSGTRMVVADASGVMSTQTIPAGASLANPTGTIGLTAVNGVLTTPPRSDGAPALSQAIVPTWTGIHTFTPAPVFSSVTASQILSVNGSKALTSTATTGTGSVMLAASPTTTGTLTTDAIAAGSNINVNSAVNDATSGINVLNKRIASAGTSGNNGFAAYGVGAPGATDQSVLFMFHNGTEARIFSAINGSGSHVPLIFASGNVDAFKVNTNGTSEFLTLALTRATAQVPSTFGSTSGTISVDAAVSDFYRVTLTGNATLANPTNSGSTNIRHFTVRVKQDATGSRTLDYGNNYRFPGGLAPVLTTTANAVDYLSFILDEAAGKWDFVGNAFNLLPVGS